MKTDIDLREFAGQWKGSKRLWMAPEDPVRDSDFDASLDCSTVGAFATLRYAWSFDSTPQEGVLVIRVGASTDADAMCWIDSFHTGGKFMRFNGEADSEGRISALGSYPAPEGPDWGWRIVLAPEPRELLLLMYNITPDGQVYPAVEARCRR